MKAQPWLPAAAANEQPKPQPPYIFAVEYSSYFYSLLQVAGVRHLRRALIINTAPGGEISTTDEPPKAPIASQKPIRDIYLNWPRYAPEPRMRTTQRFGGGSCPIDASKAFPRVTNSKA